MCWQVETFREQIASEVSVSHFILFIKNPPVPFSPLLFLWVREWFMLTVEGSVYTDFLSQKHFPLFATVG